MSRLSRDQNDRIRLLLSVDERGVDLHSVERGLVDTADYNLAIEAAMVASHDVGKRKEIERAKQETEQRLEKATIRDGHLRAHVRRRRQAPRSWSEVRRCCSCRLGAII
ncbi:hypothetical protein GWG54_20050 [Natronococcus sp. JC468]|uniref:hypothetical protein n=1 Tax=Natronococcus sp. JC468 TaxID=1961921 RepID=UPI00143A2915|nr:hypothetical protein [Natronococcus sp. JC468]